MDEMNVETIYDVSIWHVFDQQVGLLPVTVGFLFLYSAIFHHDRGEAEDSAHLASPGKVALFGILFVAVGVVLMIPKASRFYSDRKALNSGTFSVVEGPVTAIQTKSVGKSSEQSFSVAGVRFFLPYAWPKGPLLSTTAFGKTIFEGENVRISYVPSRVWAAAPVTQILRVQIVDRPPLD